MQRTGLVLFLIVTLLAAGCATDTRKKKGAAIGAAVGTAVGAGVGYAVGGKKGAAIGAGTGLVVGGLTGAAVGAYMDKQERDMRQALASAEAASVQREENILRVSFKADMMFDTDSAILKPGAYAEIDRVARVLNQYPQTRIQIQGHTDSTGSEEYNMKLSGNRADAVLNALVVRGVDPARMRIVAFGESRPIADNASEAGRQMNRRVEVVIEPVEA